MYAWLRVVYNILERNSNHYIIRIAKYVHPLDCERPIAHKSARCHKHIASTTKHIYYIQSPLNSMK